MRFKRLILPGDFVEAFLYFDFLWLVHEAGDVWAFDIAACMHAKFPSDADTATMVFARNDLLSSNSTFENFEDFSPAVRAFIDQGDVELTREELERFSRIFDTKIDARSVLDMRCYYSRAYIATEKSVVQFKLFGRDQLAHVSVGARANGQLGGVKVHDAKCLQFRSQYGVISAACGTDGAWYAREASSGLDTGWTAKFEKFATVSHATEFVADRLTSIASFKKLDVFRTKRQNSNRIQTKPPIDSGSEVTEREEITEVSGIDEDIEAGVAKELSQASSTVEFPPVKLFLTRNVLFAFHANAAVTTIRLADHGEVVAPRARQVSKSPGPVLSSSTSSLGLLIELDEAVCVLSGNRWQQIYDGPVYSVRGYPGAKWYRRLVTAVGDGRTELIFSATERRT